MKYNSIPKSNCLQLKASKWVRNKLLNESSVQTPPEVERGSCELFCAENLTELLLQLVTIQKITGNCSFTRTSTFPPLLQMLSSWPSHGATYLRPLREQELLHRQLFHNPLHSARVSYPRCQQRVRLLPCINIFRLGKLSRYHQLDNYNNFLSTNKQQALFTRLNYILITAQNLVEKRMSRVHSSLGSYKVETGEVAFHLFNQLTTS